jgi:hypothetical protein
VSDTLKIISWDQNSMKAVISINNADSIEVMVPWENDTPEKVQAYLGKLAADYIAAQAMALVQAQSNPVMPVLDLSDVIGQDLPVPAPMPAPVIEVL